MAGLVIVSDDVSWSVATWLFDYVCSGVAATVPGTTLSAEIDEVVVNNLGAINLAEEADWRELFCHGLASFLETVEEADHDFPPVGKGRVVASMRELLAMVEGGS